MTGYLLDTVACSRLRRGDPHVTARVASLPEAATVYISVITVGELEKGIHLAPAQHKDKLRVQILELLEQFPLLEVTRRVAEKYGEIVSQVTATAKAANCARLTRDSVITASGLVPIIW